MSSPSYSYAPVTTTNRAQIMAQQINRPWSAAEPPKPKRPSNLPNAFRIGYHSISGYSRDDCPTHYRYEKKGWKGLSVSNFSDREWKLIRKWCANKVGVKVFRKDRCNDTADQIGSYSDYCGSVWIESDFTLKAFKEFIDSFPVRDKVKVISQPKAALAFLKGEGVDTAVILKGSKATAIGVNCDDTTWTLLLIAAL